MGNFSLHPDVVWVDRPDGSVRLIHLAGNTCSLDAASAGLLRSILEHGIGRATTNLISSCCVHPREARTDVHSFAAALSKERILRNGQHSTTERLKRRAAIGLVSRALAAADSASLALEKRARRLLFVARWATLQFGWSATYAAWNTTYPQPASTAASHAAQLVEIDEVVRDAATQSLLKYECKERALACLALGRHAGFHTEPVLGVAFNPMRAHVWVESGDRIFSDDPEHCRTFERIALCSRVGLPLP